MERIQLINSQRMEWCCTDYGTTPYELASKLNIPLATMERVLRGEDGLTFLQLSKIASFLAEACFSFWSQGQSTQPRSIPPLSVPWQIKIFFSKATATTGTNTLSLHDALPN